VSLFCEDIYRVIQEEIYRVIQGEYRDSGGNIQIQEEI